MKGMESKQGKIQRTCKSNQLRYKGMRLEIGYKTPTKEIAMCRE